MNAPHSAPVTAPPAGRTLARPIVLGGSRGWLHGGAAQRGVLMVGAQGFDAFCAYQSWRAFADMLAEAGLAALRFDYPGEGDSRGTPDEAGGVASWTAAIRDWHDWMQAELGLEDIAVVGLRLGGLLAASALWERQTLHRLALLAPPRTGASYGRELRVAALLSAQAKPGSKVDETGVDLCGHFLPSQALRDIAALESWTFERKPDRQILIASPSDSDAGRVVEAMTSAAGTVETIPLDGLQDMLVGPTASRTPWTAFEETVRWLACEPSAQPLSTPRSGGLAARDASCAGLLRGGDYVEKPCLFGRETHLAGILCEPAQPRPGAPPVLFLNSGANPHVGWARAHVEKARALAQDGITSLRMDASGIGDAVWSKAGPRPLLYSPVHAADIRDAVDVLMERGFVAPVLVGLCAGAFGAINALSHDPRLSHAIAVNPLRLAWHAHDDLDEAEKLLLQSARTYASKIANPGDWRRLLSGHIGPRKLLSAAGLIAGKLTRRLEVPLSRVLGLEMPVSSETRQIRAKFAGISRRGARLELIYSPDDVGREELERHFGAGARLLQGMPGIDVALLPESDHELTPRPAREQVLAHIRRAVLPAA